MYNSFNTEGEHFKPDLYQADQMTVLQVFLALE